MDLKIEKIIVELKNEMKKTDSPFLPGQINEILPFLYYIQNNTFIKNEDIEFVAEKLSAIGHFSVDSWPFDNEIAIELNEITEVYGKLIKNKLKR